MSWFNKRPKPKNPPKLTPHRSSPMQEKIKEERKKSNQSNG